MKKRVLLGLFICLLSGLFSSYTTKEDSKQFAQRFIKTYFTVNDYTKIKVQDINFVQLYLKDYSKAIHNLMSEEAFSYDHDNRGYYLVLQSSVLGKYNTQIEKIKIDKSQANKDGSFVIDYTAKLNQLFSNKTEAQNIIGQVCVKKTSGAWKVIKNWYDARFMMTLKK
jgi:hypothetical protein